MSYLNPRQLEAFRAVMQTGSITAGAAHLRVTQPAVTRLIRDLEKSLGFTLFERRHGRVTPTPAAAALAREVDRCFVGLDRIGKAANDIRQGRAGSLRIAAIPALAMALIPKSVARFLGGHPQIRIDLIDGSSVEVAEWVASGSFDLGFATVAASHPRVVLHRLSPVRAVAVMAPAHPLAERATIAPADLAGEALVALTQSTRLRRQLDGALERARVEVQPRIQTPLSAVACALAAAGAGVAVVEPFTADLLKGLGMVVKPLREEVRVEYAMLTPAGRTPSAPAAEFMELISRSFPAATRAARRSAKGSREPRP